MRECLNLNNKKIAFISPQHVFSSTSGVESRIFNIYKSLRNQGNKIFVFGPMEEVPRNNYYGFVYHWKLSKIFKYKQYKIILTVIKKNKIRYIYCNTVWSFFYGVLLKIKGMNIFFDDHNVEFLRFKRTGNPMWLFVFLVELLFCKVSDKVICVSEKDKEYLIKYFKLNPKKISVVENPVDKTIFFPNPAVRENIRQKLGFKEGEEFILFFGQLNYQPNVEAVKIIFNKILPHMKSNQKIVICGKGDAKGFLKKNKHPQIIFEGFVEKIQDYINACDYVIAPLISGSGTRIKILEALACGKKVISTPIGAEGIEPQKNLIIKEDWQDFV